MTRPNATFARIPSPGNAAIEATALASGLGAAGLWLAVLITQWDRLTAYGALCAESVGFLGHCPLCYPAAALSLLSVAMAGVSLRRGAQPAPAMAARTGRRD
jgi:hypothetical protein